MAAFLSAVLFISKYLGQEVLQALALRMLKYILGRTFFNELTVSHEQHAVADLTGKAHLVGNDDHRHALVGKLLHNVENLADHFGVECTRRLVKEHNVRLHAQRAHDGDTLFLAAGELAGIRIGAVGKAYACEKLHSLGFRVLLAFSEKLHRRKGHISEQCHMRKEVEVLENHTHLLTVEIYIAARISYINAVKGYRAAGGHLKEIEASEEG